MSLYLPASVCEQYFKSIRHTCFLESRKPGDAPGRIIALLKHWIDSGSLPVELCYVIVRVASASWICDSGSVSKKEFDRLNNHLQKVLQIMGSPGILDQDLLDRYTKILHNYLETKKRPILLDPRLI
jgi:hypothetical protein